MDPFLGEIRLFTWDWAPSGWALCNGALLPVQQNAALNALLGQTYGGNGSTTFALPDLRGRTPVHLGRDPNGLNYAQGSTGGQETVTLTTANLPLHTHSINALSGTLGNAGGIAGNIPAKVAVGTGGVTVNIYSVATSATPVQLVAATFGSSGGGTGHNNMQPFAVLNFCIAVLGLFPPRQ